MTAPMRFGLVGYGLWGRLHAEAIKKAPDALLVAVACASRETAAAAERDLPGVLVHRDYRALLARSDIDAVDIVVPNHLHAEVGVAALEAGKDVLLEKPMAPTVEDCDRLLEAARRSGRVLSIAELLELVWGKDVFLTDRVVYTHINNLRGKIEEDPSRPRFIVSVRGAGYRFDG